MQEREEAWHRIFDKAFENPDVSMKAMMSRGLYIKIFMVSFYGWGSTVSRPQSHNEETE